MEIPITVKDVQFLMLLVNQYLRKQRRAYHRYDQQLKVKAIRAEGRYDAHLGGIDRAEALLSRLAGAIQLP